MKNTFYKIPLVLLSCLLWTGLVQAQTDSLKISPADVAQICNVTPEYLQETNDVAYSSSSSRGGPIYTSPSSFNPNAIITCGSFKVYYEDMNMATADGYDDPTLGAVRRATLCAVLNYIESTFSMNVNAQTDFIEIYVQRSLTASNPAPPGTSFLANAGPYYPSTFGSTQAIFDGYFHNHVINATDPAPSQYDAHIETNFHGYFDPATSAFFPINYWNDYLNTSATCRFDLYSVLLHEVTHAMGFLSCVVENPAGTHPAVCGNSGNSFSQFDDLFLYHGNPCTMSYTKVVQSNVINPSLTTNNPLRTNSIWLENTAVPVNQPIYSGVLDPFYPLRTGSLMSHLNSDILAFTGQSQFAPGYQPNYVMGPSIGLGQRKRTWTIPEHRILLDLGYTLTPAFAASNSLVLPGGTMNNSSLLITNTPPYRTNCATPVLAYNTPFNFMELMAVDFPLTNNNTPTLLNNSSVTINIGSLASINDLETGTQLFIAPNSLFGIRGVSNTGVNNGGNNHACLQVNSSMNQIIYTPIPGFHGRAQFGFYLSDGNERGALRIVTIDVSPGGYILNPGDQMVTYPDLEDGTEVRQRVLNPNHEYTQIDDWAYEGVFAGQNFSGGHNFNFVTNWWNVAGGDITENSWYACFMGANPQHGYYGSATHDWNSTNMGLSYPVATPASGPNDRYHHFQGPNNYSTLINQVQACNIYRFECDLNFEKTNFTVGQTFQFQLQFVDNPSPGLHTQLYYTAPVQVTITTVAPDSWQHVVFDFQYCGTSTYFMNLLVQGIVTPQVVVTGTGSSSGPTGGGAPLNLTFTPAWYSPVHCPFIDNITLEQITPTPPPLTLNVSANPTTVCNGGTTSLSAFPVGYLPCNATYTWTPGNIVGNTVTSGPVTSTTTFTATVNYACSQAASGTVTVTPSAIPVLTPVGPFCSNNSTPQLLTATPPGGTFTGTGVTFSSGSYYFTPSVAGVGTHTVTYTYIPFAGCTTVVTQSIQVSQTPAITFGVNGPYCSTQGPQNLNVQPTGGTWSGPGIVANQFDPSVAGTFTLTYSVTIAGCTSTATVNVVVGTAPTITITPVGPLCQYDPIQNLTVSQGTGTFSGPGVSGSTFNPAIANVGNNVITWTGTVNVCPVTATTTIVVNPGVGPASWPKFVTGVSGATRSWFNGVTSDAQGNVYATGFIGGSSAVPSFGSYSGNHIIVVKYNEKCGGVWIRTIPSTGSEGMDITLDNNGDVLVTGVFTGTNVNFGNSQLLTSPAGATEAFLWKLDKNTGNTVYAVQSTSPVSGSPSNAVGRGVKYDATNNAIYITGDFANTVKFGTLANVGTSGDRDVFAVRYNPSTTLPVWSVKVGSAYVGKPDIAANIGTDASGNVFVGCTVSGSVVTPVAATNTTPGTTDLFIVKLVAGTGAYGGANVIRGNSTDDVFLKDMYVDAGGRCYITGSYKGALTLGSVLPVAATRDIFIGFATTGLVFTGTWSYACGSSNASSMYNNDLYFTGSAYNGAAFTGFTTATVTSPTQSYEAFVARVLSNGTRDFLEFSTTSGCAAKTTGLGITVSSFSSSIFTGGRVDPLIACATPNITFNGPALVYQGGEHAYLARNNPTSWFRLGNPDNSIADTSDQESSPNFVNIFPNPSTGQVTLAFGENISGFVHVTVTDISGRLISSSGYQMDKSSQLQIDLGNCENGVYLVSINNGSEQKIERIVIQH
jgi:hypothetical protein